MVDMVDCLGLVGKEVLVKGLLSYSCLRVSGCFSLLSVSGTVGTLGFEVWKIRPPSGRYVNRWGLRFPSDEEFGYYGWSYQSEEAAVKKYEELCSSELVK